MMMVQIILTSLPLHPVYILMKWYLNLKKRNIRPSPDEESNFYIQFVYGMALDFE